MGAVSGSPRIVAPVQEGEARQQVVDEHRARRAVLGDELVDDQLRDPRPDDARTTTEPSGFQPTEPGSRASANGSITAAPQTTEAAASSSSPTTRLRWM